METLLARGSKWLRDKLPQAAREFVEYADGPHVIENLEVIQGNSEVADYQVEDANGTYKSIDWYVAATHLVLDGKKVEPKRGHEIRRKNEIGRKEVYTVLPTPGGREFEVVDERLGLFLRVHSKQTK